MEMSPKQIVQELDKYIIGQKEAKKMVAIALRNRYRRSKLDQELREEITPKNIIMKGPTGCGKTEIARRLSKIVGAPFIKVEATKFTEVGYVGRDVESMIRDLVEASFQLVKKEQFKKVKMQSEQNANVRILDAIIRALSKEEITKEVAQENYLKGVYDDLSIEIDVIEMPKQINIMGGAGMDINMGEIFENVLGSAGRKRKKRLPVKAAKEILIQEECEKLIDLDAVKTEAVMRAEQSGIIFIDEIDKIAGKGGGNGKGPDVSREGVQRDILPIVEGSTVSTKYGTIKTDYILFIAAGAFHIAGVEDLIPELQGRFPVVVELNSLTSSDFEEILKNTENSLIMQYTKLLGVDNIKLNFTTEAIKKISYIAEKENETKENIGARRLQSILENLLEDISFNASGDHPEVEVTIDEEYINKNLSNELIGLDLKKYIL